MPDVCCPPAKKNPAEAGLEWWDEQARGSMSSSRPANSDPPSPVPARMKDFSAPARLRRAGRIRRALPPRRQVPERFTSIPQTTDIARSGAPANRTLNAGMPDRASAKAGSPAGSSPLRAARRLYRLLTIFRQYRNVGTPSDIRSQAPSPGRHPRPGFSSSGCVTPNWPAAPVRRRGGADFGFRGPGEKEYCCLGPGPWRRP